MNNRNLDKKTIDTIGRKLIERTGVSERVIDNVVTNPDLFTLVQKRIAANENSIKTAFGPLGIIRRHSAAFASVAVLVIAGIAGTTLLRTGNEPTAANVVSISAEMPETARPIFPPLRKGSDPTPGRALNLQRAVEPTVEKAAYRNPVRQPQPKVNIEAEGEFYAVSAPGDPNQSGVDNRIIRVDVPRSSLFAMGVNVPLENGAETVKADLLVGPDGVTRAIRVVK